LWIECATYSAGNWNCYDYHDVFISLPSLIQAARILGIASIITVFIGFILCIFEFNTNSEQSVKKTYRNLGSLSSLLGAVCILVATSSFANDIRSKHLQQTDLNDSFHQMYKEKREVYGDCIYMGWIGSILCIFSAILNFCKSDGSTSFQNTSQTSYTNEYV